MIEKIENRIPNYVFGYGNNFNPNSIALYAEIPLAESYWSLEELKRMKLYRHNKYYHIHVKYGHTNISPIHIDPEMSGVVV